MKLTIGDVLGIVVVSAIAGGGLWEWIRTKAPKVAQAADTLAGGGKGGTPPTQQK